jgi:hypothetical protein
MIEGGPNQVDENTFTDDAIIAIISNQIKVTGSNNLEPFRPSQRNHPFQYEWAERDSVRWSWDGRLNLGYPRRMHCRTWPLRDLPLHNVRRTQPFNPFVRWLRRL